MSGERILLSESAALTMKAQARIAHPYETGGILLGVLSGKTPWITTTVEIPTMQRGRTHYRLPAGATHPAVREARRQDTRVGYLGDWHSHPSDTGPSPVDIATVFATAIRGRLRRGPLLVVARRNGNGYHLDVRQATLPRLDRMSVSLAGDLPVLDWPNGSTRDEGPD